jgi:hypothetical protein
MTSSFKHDEIVIQRAAVQLVACAFFSFLQTDFKLCSGHVPSSAHVEKRILTGTENEICNITYVGRSSKVPFSPDQGLPNL